MTAAMNSADSPDRENETRSRPICWRGERQRCGETVVYLKGMFCERGVRPREVKLDESPSSFGGQAETCWQRWLVKS